jgi:outer membrane beta-barrel protein
MIGSGLRFLFIFTAAFVLNKVAFAAESVELPQEELAQESVLPIFDKPVSVKNRSVLTAGRFDADFFYGMALTEPIADVSKLGLAVYYNMSEDYALGLLYAKNSTGLSTYANQLHSQFALDFNRVPKPDSTLMVDFNIKAFYGKMSLTKSTVFNLMLFGSASGGMVKYEHKSYPAIALGLGQKFFFTSRLALRMDMRLYVHQAPIPFLNSALRDGSNGQPSDTVPSPGDFKERITYTTNLDVGLSYLF